MSAALRTTIQELIQNAAVVVFSKSYCPYCVEAKNILNKGGVQYELKELDEISEG